MNTKSPLPYELSDLLELAVNDAKIIKQTPGYILNMHTWHTPDLRDTRLCGVCMAGAIMVCELNAPRNKTLNLGDVRRRSIRTADSLGAIEYLRQGLVSSASAVLGSPTPPDDVCKAFMQTLGQWMFHEARYSWAGYMRGVKVLRGAGY